MKITHIKTQFLFTVDGVQYSVLCPTAIRGENQFIFYKDGEQIGRRIPNGGHVNKTSAQKQLERFLKNQD